MQLVFGGAHQGKWHFVKTRLLDRPYAYWDGRELRGSLVWPAEEEELVINRFHHWVRHCVAEDLGMEAFLQAFLEEARGRRLVIVMDELGASLVPVDPFERAYREAVGRCLQILGAEAQLVLRILAGQALLLKGWME